MKRIAALVLLPLLCFTVPAVAQTSDVAPVDSGSIVGTVQDGAGDALQKNEPSYPIAADVVTTLNRTVVAKPHGAKTLLPSQVSKYAPNHYGEWRYVPGFPFVRPDMETGDIGPSVPDPSAAKLLSFFTMSDVHIADKESPARCIYLGYHYPEPLTKDGPAGNSSAYSAVILYTTQVLDAAVQTINAVHKKAPFDFGIALGDATDNTQYNELRWYIGVLDGNWITPSSGAHLGADRIDYQKPFQAAGLDKSIRWYQTIGNHDQFWMGSYFPIDYIRETLVGPDLLNIGPVPSLPADWATIFSSRGFYMGVVDGSTKFGNIIDAGPVNKFAKPPQVIADPARRSLSMKDWMGEFSNTTTKPVGHGFTKKMVEDGFACYHFYPRANVPLKVIVLDDTDRVGGGASGALDRKRYEWLVKELDDGEAAGELMIICAHIPILPYGRSPDPPYEPWSVWATYSYKTDVEVLEKLHTYKNLLLWIAGHVHRNAITPQPAGNGNPENDFWEVETPSLRDFPQEFRRFEIVRNSDNTISIFTLDVDTAVNPAPLGDGSPSPARTSRSYAVATQQIFKNPVGQGPHINKYSGVYNAELVKQLSPAMQAKIAKISPVVGSFKIDDGAASTGDRIVTLNNTVAGSAPTHYMASESPGFKGAVWRPYSKAPSFTLSSTAGTKTVYLKVKDGSGNQSGVKSDEILRVKKLHGN